MEAISPKSIKTASTQALLDLWDATEGAPYTPELPTVRGWIMDELQRRDPAAYAAWQDVDPFADPEHDTPRCWFTI